VAQGGGNLIQDGAAFLRSLLFTDSLTAARTAGLIAPGGASVISNDGGSFLPNMNQVPAIAGILGFNGSGIIGENSSGLIAKNSTGIISQDGNGLLTDNGAAAVYSAQSVSAAKAAVITGPATWTYGQPAMVTWTPAAGTAACPSGYLVLINGTTPLGNATMLSVGKSLLPANSVPRGKVSVSLLNACTGAPVTAPYTTTIQ
jgi:hypothetical protein